MGREIRRVPAGWEHPRQQCPHSPWAGGCDEAKAHNGQCSLPLYDADFETRAREWLDAAIAWDNGTNPDTVKHKAAHPFYWQWSGDPPDPKHYRPKWTDAERTHYQVYETVSEGTPTSPVFGTLDDLKAWLIAEGHSQHAAAEFVRGGWAPSMVITSKGVSGLGIDALDDLR